MRKNIIVLCALFFVVFIQAQQIDPLIKKDSYGQQIWVDSILKSMTLDQKIGQLFMIQAYSNKGAKHKAFIENLIKKYEIGGLIFMQGTPQKQATLNNYYQDISKVPLLIGFDGEWGLNMRLKNTYRFPWNMTLGAIQDNQLIEQFGEQVGKHCKRLGIHINFAPVVDVNINPKNPIIGNRSFGESRENVADKAMAFTKGLQGQNVLANAKHFPGHGDTDADSHLTLPTIPFSKERLDSIELYPYKKLFDVGVASVMTAHLSIPSLEPNTSLPSSLSHNVVTDLLKNKMGFEGLIITDALNMKGSADFSSPAEINLAALLAGNDILLIPQDVPATVAKIKKAVTDSILTEERLNFSVKKILKAKYWVGLKNYKPIRRENLHQELNTMTDEALHYSLVENSITLLKNNGEDLPIRELTDAKIAYVKFGDADNNTFIERLNDYAQVDVISDKNLDQMINKLKPYNHVIIGYHKSNANPWKDFKFTNKELVWLQEIARNNCVILDIFASPYSLLDIKTFTNIESVLVSYQNSKIAQDISAQMIFGGLSANGKLPVSINDEFAEGFGLQSIDLKRLSYGLPEGVGMSSEKLNRIDSIAKVVIDGRMAPGMQVLVARYGKVIFRKNYGYHTYKKAQKVQKNNLYDLASLTKILGGLPMIMKAEEEGKFTLENTLGELMPVLKGSNKDTVTVKEALAHYGRLRPWIPYYIKTLDSITQKPLPKYYRKNPSKKFKIKIAENLYLRTDYMDTIYQLIAEAPQRKRLAYRYSGLPFYLFKDYIEKQYQQPMNTLNDEAFYKPLGARTLTYKPLEKFDKMKIVPTERDNYYRQQLLRGYVHDMGAAMLDGVSGNAGLFANSNDVAKMMQLYLQKGFYGGKRFLKQETIQKFNHRYYEEDNVRRGLGFDKPQLDPEIKASCGCVSSKSFGHSGFTGTYTWADPETELLYVFLSNRVYPTMKNNKLGKQNIRTIVQQLIQDAIIE
ncbi:MAG: serine hydrolase [Flavobacteriaceae bacterium]|nr:serine hydrolase [Flavobacteriaceae bacterium]